MFAVQSSFARSCVALAARAMHTRAPIERKRVLGAIAHINSGKTTTSEAMLYAAGALRRMGNVDAGDTTMDYLPAERERGITINAAAIAFAWRDHTLFLVDSPGHLDFTYEVERALRVMDSAIVLLDAVAGVQPQTETVWRQADTNNLPRLVFVNKMDRDGADLQNTLHTVRQYFAASPLLLQQPVFDDAGVFYGVHDLLSQFPHSGRARPVENPNDALPLDALPTAQRDAAVAAKEVLLETIAEHDDEIMALWVDGAPVSRSKMQEAIRAACLCHAVVPVLCGASLRAIGVEPLLDAVIDYLPAPPERADVVARTVSGDDVTVRAKEDAPFVAYAFKITHERHRGRMVHLRALAGQLDSTKASFLNTTSGKTETPNKMLRILADKYEEISYIGTGDIFATVGLKNTNTGDTLVLRGAPRSAQVVLDGVRAPPTVFSVALEVESSTQEKELEQGLDRLLDGDSSLELRQDEDTGETLLSGMGELHLEVAIDSLERKLSFPIHRSRPRVSYREAPSAAVTHRETLDSVIGTSHMKASLAIRVEPLDSAQDDSEVQTSESFAPEQREAIRSGVEAALGRGPLTGAHVTGARIVVSHAEDGDGSDIAGLRACAGRGVRNALRKADVVLLEPVMRVALVVPDAQVGDVVKEITHPTKRRGMVENVEADTRFAEVEIGRVTNVTALVPLEGMIGWATKMRSITKGRGDLQMQFEEYRRVDGGTQDRLVSQTSSFASTS